MPDAPKTPPGGFTLDLSTGAAPTGKRKRKGPPPVVMQTINLSTPKAPAVPPEVAAPASGTRGADAPRPDAARDRHDDARRPRGGGTSLADLLDEATLARLRGRP